MKVYLINLDKDMERLAAADRQLKRLGVEYERVSAVYAKGLPQEELDAAVNKFRWWCAVGRPVRVGEIGCAMSHLKVYEKMASEGVDIACILEDDVVIADGFPEALNSIEKKVDAQSAAVIQLGNRWNPPGEDWGLRRVACEYGTYAYVITRKAASAVSQHNWPMERPCDHWHEWQKDGFLTLWQFMPSVCEHDDERFVSGVTPPGSFLVKNLKPMQYCLHKLKRLVGKTVDKILRIV